MSLGCSRCTGTVARLHCRAAFEVSIRPAVRALLLYLIAQTAAVVLLFLLFSSFFTAWDGAAVSVLQPRADATVVQVLIVNDDGSTLQRTWPSSVVTGLSLPVDALALAPSTVPEDAIRTRKSRYQLQFLIQRPGEDGERQWQGVPTTSAQGVGMVVLLWLIGLGLRNMLYAGSPLAIERSRVFLPKAQAASGTVAGGGVSRGRKSPPPGRKRRGPRR
jgi:hypothetical protein